MPMKFRVGTFARFLLLVVSLIGVVPALFGLYVAIRPVDSLGLADKNCATEIFPPVPNGEGMVATAHETSCDYAPVHGDDTTYVYIHRAEERDSAKSLVFRFENIPNGESGQSPRLLWSDNLTLHISVSQVGEITKQLASLGQLRISYSIGRENTPAGSSQRFKVHIAEASFGLLIFMIGIFILTVRSLRKERAASPLLERS